MTSEIMEWFCCYFTSVIGLSRCNTAKGDDNDITSNLKYYKKGEAGNVFWAFDLGCPTINMTSGSSEEQKAMSHNKVEKQLERSSLVIVMKVIILLSS
jgi:hypothetical protein